MDQNNIQAFNQMSAKALCIRENAELNFVKNPKTGKIFFSCGSIKNGYVSPKVQENLGNLKIEDIQYAEVSIDGNEPVPTIMMNPSNNTVRTLGSNLLHN
jgi:hypothetical protein